MKCTSIILTAILCFAVPGLVSAQRTLPAQRGIQLTTGSVMQKGFYWDASFSQYAKGGDKWLFGVEYLEKRHSYKDINIPQSQFTAEGGYLFNFLSNPRKTCFVSIGASVLMGYETVNWNEKLLFDGATINNGDAFLYGGAVTLEWETYLSNRLVLLVNLRERLLGGSSAGLLNTQFGLGLKFIIN